jgi:hypothetical protein
VTVDCRPIPAQIQDRLKAQVTGGAARDAPYVDDRSGAHQPPRPFSHFDTTLL